MSEIVFILGAGASVDAGAPVMSNFLDRARDIWADPQLMDQTQHMHFQRVFEALQALQAVHSKSSIDLINIENVFTLFEMAELLKRMPGDLDPTELVGSLKKLISTTLSLSIKFPIDRGGLRAPAGYNQFVEMLVELSQIDRGRHTYSIITFNYDLALDFALRRTGLRYGMISGEGNHGVLLMKLHGSLNWAAKRESSDVFPLMPDALLNKTDKIMWTDRESIYLSYPQKIQEWAAALGEPNAEPEPVIVPPTWKKGEHHVALARVWRNAADHLREAQHIFVCGYSLPQTDGFFKLLYSLGTAGGNPLRSFEVMDPDPAANDRFKELLGPGARDRYRFHKGYFADFPQLVLSRFR